jgi:dTDP-4-dehydrorhamnose reductase
MTHILVTGASGLLGSNIVREASQVFEVTAVVHEHLIEFEGVGVISADLTDASRASDVILGAIPDWVIHCAADTAIDDLEEQPERAQRMNVGMTRNVARACAELGAGLLHVSTDSVFSGEGGPYSETDHPEPKNVYARSKLDGERAAIDELPEALVVRTNLFGWGPGDKRSLAEWFYLNLKNGISVPGFTDIHFSPVYASELAHIFFRMLRAELRGLYHVAGASCVSKFEFGLRLAHAFGFDQGLIQAAQSEEIDWGARRPKVTCLDGSKLADELGIERPDLGDGLAHFRADLDERLLAEGEQNFLGGIDA